MYPILKEFLNIYSKDFKQYEKMEFEIKKN